MTNEQERTTERVGDRGYGVGDHVRMAEGIDGPECRSGRVVEVRPQNGGCLVKHHDGRGPFGWGWEEMEPAPWWSGWRWRIPWMWVAALLIGIPFIAAIGWFYWVPIWRAAGFIE